MAMKWMIMALAGAMLVSACGGKDVPGTPDAPDAPEAPETPETTAPETPDAKPQPAQADAGWSLSRKAAYFKGDVTFPDGLRTRAPKVADVILTESRLDLDEMERLAKAELSGEDMPYDLATRWEVAGEAGPLMSLVKSTYTFTGGAHGNSYLNGRLYETASGERVQIADMFEDVAAASVPVIDAVRAAISEQKMERFGATGVPTDTITGEVSDGIPQSGELPGEIALVASTEAGKFGGLVAMYSPYEIGAYAEGSYQGVISQDVFRDLLKPEYADLFAGAPVYEAN